LRSLIFLLIGAVAGAALFHVYYLRLEPRDRCGWDHPRSAQLRTKCQSIVDSSAANDEGAITTAGSKAGGYAKRARHELDDLIGNVSQ
jgi:hypothetical protein